MNQSKIRYNQKVKSRPGSPSTYRIFEGIRGPRERKPVSSETRQKMSQNMIRRHEELRRQRGTGEFTQH